MFDHLLCRYNEQQQLDHFSQRFGQNYCGSQGLYELRMAFIPYKSARKDFTLMIGEYYGAPGSSIV